MNELDALEALFPAPPPMTEADRAAMRSDLFGTPSPMVRRREPDPGRRWMAVAASVIVLAGTVGIWAVSQNRTTQQSPPAVDRPAADSSIEPTPPSEPSTDAEPAPDGALILDQFPDALASATGYTYVAAPEVVGPQLPDGTWVQRWYTATMVHPEIEPRIKLATTSTTRQFPDEIPPNDVAATRTSVRGGAGWLYDDPVSDGRVVAFIDGETAFVLTGYQLSDDELLRAAAHSVLADDSAVGAVIQPDGLPDGLFERAVGLVSEAGFRSFDTLQHPHASVRWYIPRADGGPPSDGAAMLWLGWEIEDPSLVPLHRLDYATVTDTTVRGVPAFLAANDDSGPLVIVWSENGYTYALGAWGLEGDTLIEAVDQLRPATDAEWNALESEPG